MRTFIFCLIVILLMAMATSNQGAGIGPLGPSDVQIAPNCIIMPVGRILLVRKDSDYCAIKFTEFWTGKTKEDLYAKYESYYQGDKTGDFSNKNIKFKKEDLSWPKAKTSIFGHPWAPGTKDEIRCGPIKLWWTGKGTVYFYKRYQPESDYGIELAPTKWTDISQVNVFDSRLKWYRYDEKRKDVIIPVDQLWEEK